MAQFAAQEMSTSDEDLFNPNLINKMPVNLDDVLALRPLRTSDYDKGFLQLLSQLTEVGNVSKDQFLNRFYKMKMSGCYYVVVVEDLRKKKIIGSATLVVEMKFIHNCCLRGHLEDVVVNGEYRGKQLGKLVVKTILQLSRQVQCYKLTLECKNRLIPFYESLGFAREHENANSLNIRFPNEHAHL